MPSINRSACRCALAATVAAALAAVASCRSMPAPISAADTVVAVPVLRMTTRVDDTFAEVSYQVNIRNVDTDKTYSIVIDVSSKESYLFIKGLPCGTYELDEYVPHGLVGASNEDFDTARRLTVAPGKLSLFPVKVVSIIFTREWDGAPTFYINFTEYDEKERDRMIEYLRKDKNFPLWSM